MPWVAYTKTRFDVDLAGHPLRGEEWSAESGARSVDSGAHRHPEGLFVPCDPQASVALVAAQPLPPVVDVVIRMVGRDAVPAAAFDELAAACSERRALPLALPCQSETGQPGAILLAARLQAVGVVGRGDVRIVLSRSDPEAQADVKPFLYNMANNAHGWWIRLRAQRWRRSDAPSTPDFLP